MVIPRFLQTDRYAVCPRPSDITSSIPLARSSPALDLVHP